MGVDWVLMKIEKNSTCGMRNAKRWNLSTNRSAEAIVLLDFIEMVVKKSYQMESGKVKATFDNERV